jgi:hypothetical protein
MMVMVHTFSKFAQLYIHDTDNEIEHRIHALCGDGDVDGHVYRAIVKKLQDMLDDVNPLVKTFKTARSRPTKGKS